MSPVRVVVARGDPMERGRTVGWELADLIRSSLEFYWRYLVRRGVGAGQLPGEAARCRLILAGCWSRAGAAADRRPASDRRRPAMIKVRVLRDGQHVEDVAMAELPAVRAEAGP